MPSITIALPARTKMVVTADAVSNGAVYRLPDQPGGGDPGAASVVAASGSVTIGPFAFARTYLVDSKAGTLAVALTAADTQAAVADAAALTAAAPPAGGTGTAAGGYDTAVNRDAMITSLTNLRTDVGAMRTTLNNALAALRAYGIILP